MDRYSVYTAGFSAAHVGGISHTKVPDTRPHGHDFRVRVEAKVPENPDLSDALFALVAEFSGRTLEEMMPGAATDATGIAAWISERLTMRFPLITRIDVEAAGHHGYVTREPKRIG